ncbi:hypothetical protein [Aeribacillus pallidus]|uniref:hypothetical protein n=1 Tax=Aeribacillus pallidus TaxID=33936 RepID=UPI001F5D847B|nr:hypothetical protein [Aeribacillus pallidus]
MSVINFFIENILTQAAVTIGLIALIGLLLQKNLLVKLLLVRLKRCWDFWCFQQVLE